MYTAYIIEFLNGIFYKVNPTLQAITPVVIKIQDLVNFLISIKDYKILKNAMRLYRFLPLSENFIEEILVFLSKHETIHKSGDSIKLSRPIDFDIEYDIPRYTLSFPSVKSIISHIRTNVKAFQKYDTSQYITYIDFNEQLSVPSFITDQVILYLEDENNHFRVITATGKQNWLNTLSKGFSCGGIETGIAYQTEIYMIDTDVLAGNGVDRGDITVIVVISIYSISSSWVPLWIPPHRKPYDKPLTPDI